MEDPSVSRHLEDQESNRRSSWQTSRRHPTWMSTGYGGGLGRQRPHEPVGARVSRSAGMASQTARDSRSPRSSRMCTTFACPFRICSCRLNSIECGAHRSRPKRHRAHYCGQVCLLAHELGYPLPETAAYTIWNCEKLGKHCGFTYPR